MADAAEGGPYDWADDGDFEAVENPYARASRINDPDRWVPRHGGAMPFTDTPCASV